MQIKEFVTGVVIAICGKEPEDQRGKFFVDDFCYKQLVEQPERPLIEKDNYVVFISGLELQTYNEDNLNLQLLIDLITGQSGVDALQEKMCDISRVVVVGNSINHLAQEKDVVSKAKYLTKKTTAGTVDAVKSLDDVLVQISASVPIDLMPGDYDPANNILPQQPLHSCMFPQASRYSTMSCVTNPYQFSHSGIEFLGHSGQPVDNIYAFSEMTDRLSILCNTLSWGHIAPSAPDTLHCYPFHDQDPFIIQSCPHVYFCGNQEKFQHKTIEMNGKKVLLMCLPKYSTTQNFVLLNLKDMSCSTLSVNTQFNSSKQSTPVDK